MTRTRYGLEATNQSTEVEDRNTESFTRLLGRGRFKRRCPWGIVCGSSQVNYYQAARSPGNDTVEKIRQAAYGIWKLNDTWVITHLLTGVRELKSVTTHLLLGMLRKNYS